MKTTTFVNTMLNSNNLREITGSELHGWNGLNGTGYIADVEHADGSSVSLVVDIGQYFVTASYYRLDTDWNDAGFGFVELTAAQRVALRTKLEAL